MTAVRFRHALPKGRQAWDRKGEKHVKARMVADACGNVGSVLEQTGMTIDGR